MLKPLIEATDNIIIACGPTDFRKQIEGLVTLINLYYKLDPYSENTVFIFCNKKRNSIKVLRFDENGFILANKKLLDKMKFQWPNSISEIKNISYRQMEWLLQGLEIEQKTALKNIDIKSIKTCY